MSELEMRYVVTDRGRDRAPSLPRWFVYDYRIGGIARTDDWGFAEFASRAAAYAWQRARQEPLDAGGGAV